MKIKDIRQKSLAEQQEELVNLYKEKFNLSVQKKLNQLGNPKRLTAIRKTIARIKTVMNESIRNKVDG